MIDDSRLLSLLGDVLDDLPTTAPDRLLANMLDDIRVAPQRGRWRTARGWRGIASGLSPRSLAVTAMIAVVVVSIAIVQFLPRAVVTGPGPSGSPSPGPSASATAGPPASPTAVEGLGQAFVGWTYTSHRFAPHVTFQVTANGLHGEWCAGPHTSARTIVLKHTNACVEDLRLIRPYAVDCGTPSTQPSAESLAAALLANPGLAATDLGTTDGSKPYALFAEPLQGRVIRILGGRLLDPATTDPDGCRLLPEPDSGDDVIEIRGDVPETLVLFEVNSELVVIRVSLMGHDAASAAAAKARVGGDGGPENLDHLLGTIYDIRFE